MTADSSKDSTKIFSSRYHEFGQQIFSNGHLEKTYPITFSTGKEDIRNIQLSKSRDIYDI